MDMQLYCPDCGEKLTPYYFESLVPEVNSYVHLGCRGRCLEDWCKANGLAPEGIKSGIPKYDYSAETINNAIAHRSDEGRSLSWLEKEHKDRQTAMINTIKDLSKYLYETGNRKYGEHPVYIENALGDIMVLNATASSDKAYACGFLDALGMMK